MLYSFRTAFCALLVLATLATCAPPFRPHPIGYASMAVVCAPHRAVYCASDTDPRHCASVAAAIAEINAVVPDLLEFRGSLAWSEIGRLQALRAPIVVVADIPRAIAHVPANVLAVTRVKPDDATACLGWTPMALAWQPGELTQEREYAVILHEMLHVLGAAHADGDCRWQTIMERAPTHHGLAIIDRDWLRAVYGR